jgi:hypothetical protein
MKDGGWLDNYGKKPNPNEVDVSVGPGFVGMGNDTTGRNYSPAWGGQFQSGGTLPDVVVKGLAKPKKNVLVHDPSDYPGGHRYSLKKTVTPYKTNQQIKKNTEAVENPNDIDFLFNYRHTSADDSDNRNAMAVPYQGMRHWNIDRFIIDPEFGGGYTNLKAEDDSMEAKRRNVLADMFKYQMFQHPEQSRGKSFRQAKRFVKKEIDPRVSGAFFENYMLGNTPVPGDHGSITTYANDNPFYKAWRAMQGEEDFVNKEYRKNPWDENKIEKVSKDYLINTKKLSRKETRQQIKKWKTELPSMIDNYLNPKPIDLTLPVNDMSSEEAYFKNMRGDNLPNYAMGGSLPGAVGFTYARVAGSAPSNGKYAKKTKASAQNGKEMKFYQEGLDFKPNSIAQDGGAIVDPMGQWAHPGEVTIIPGTDITMEGVDYPVLGISDTGDTQMMYPGEDYNFDGEYVTEYPMMKEGGWLSKYQSGGPLSRSNLETMAALEKDIKNQKARNAQETVSQYTPKPGDKERMNAAKDAYRAEQTKLLNRAASSKIAANTMENIVEPMLSIEMGMGASKLAKPALEAAGKYLTEKTALKNAYKLNPYAFKPTEGMMYRGLGKEGMEDALASGVFRAKQDVPPSMVGNFDMSKRFDKAYFSPKFDVADQYGQGYIAEVPRSASDWGKRYGKKEWSQIAQRDIPTTEGKILQKDWLKGYKEVPQQSPDLGSVFQLNTKGAVPPPLPEPKLSIAPRGNYLESELTKGNKISLNDVDKLGKKEIDWLQSYEYFKRRSAATGESASEIQKDVDEIVKRWGNLSVSAANTGKDAAGFYGRGKNRIVLSDKLKREEALSVLDHEVKHALSQMGGLEGSKGYKKYPTTKVDTWLNRTLGLKNAHYYAEPWEQQVRGLRLLDFIEKTQGIPRGTPLSMEDITQFARNVSPSSPSKEIMELFSKDYNDVTSQLFKMKDADKQLKFVPSNIKKLKSPFQYEQKGELRKNILDWLNRTYAVPVGIGIGAGALGSDKEVPQQKDGGWLTKYK